MRDTGLMITLAYPETIVRVSNEWFSPFLRFFGIGKKNYLRAGHAALVLINRQTGILEYHDFGRYITPKPMGRVRGKITDNELNFPLKALVKEKAIINLEVILGFLARQPQLTHGEGKLVASVCDAINYDQAKTYIAAMQHQQFIRYAAFIKEASNCTRFVTDVLIASLTNKVIKSQLQKLKIVTPSPVGNVLLADTQNYIYEVSEKGVVNPFRGSQKSVFLTCFFDKLKDYKPNLLGNLEPKPLNGLHKKAQWLSGIGAGAWFELHKTGSDQFFYFKRLSSVGHLDVYDLFKVNDRAFDYHSKYEFMHHSNCHFFHIKQDKKVFRFERVTHQD